MNWSFMWELVRPKNELRDVQAAYRFGFQDGAEKAKQEFSRYADSLKPAMLSAQSTLLEEAICKAMVIEKNYVTARDFHTGEPAISGNMIRIPDLRITITVKPKNSLIFIPNFFDLKVRESTNQGALNDE